MIDELVDLFRRQASAADLVAARTRALELVIAAGERRFLGLALDELDAASERLAALELARSLAVATAGWSADVTAADLVAHAGDPDDRARLAGAVDELREAMTRLAEVRSHAEAIAQRAAGEARARQQAAQALASA